MAQFLRIALLLVLALVGFGSGLCGTLALVMVVSDPSAMGNLQSLFVTVIVTTLAIAAACFFAVRALIGAIRRHAAASHRSKPAGPPPPPAPPATPPSA
jgi:hypothetical protein